MVSIKKVLATFLTRQHPSRQWNQWPSNHKRHCLLLYILLSKPATSSCHKIVSKDASFDAAENSKNPLRPCRPLLMCRSQHAWHRHHHALSVPVKKKNADVTQSLVSDKRPWFIILLIHQLGVKICSDIPEQGVRPTPSTSSLYSPLWETRASKLEGGEDNMDFQCTFHHTSSSKRQVLSRNSGQPFQATLLVFALVCSVALDFPGREQQC